MGDGGNDVGMIRASSVGIGIEGREGSQAALASDFSVRQFKDISTLILWHGRLSYIRTTNLCNFILHRGLIISTIQIFFMFSFNFVTVFLYNGYLTLGYATIFTNLPIFSIILDTDIPFHQVFNYPALYQLVQQGSYLSLKIFLIWFWKSVFQGSAIFLFAIAFFNDSFTEIVTITFTALIIIELLNIASRIRTWHTFIVISFVVSLVLYLLCLTFFKKILDLAPLDFFEFLKILILALIAWLPVQAAISIHAMLLPSPVDKMVLEAKLRDSRKSLSNVNLALS